MIRGVCPVVAVPFDSGGGVDTASFDRLVAHLLGEEVGALTLFGLASEFYKLADDERSLLQQVFLARTAAHPRVAGVVSITDHSADVAVRRAVAAVEGGADALNVLPPHFLGPPAQAILDHLGAVLGAVDVPVIVQYAPAQTGSRMVPADLVDLATRHPNLRAVKVEAQPPGPWITALAETSSGTIDALVGYAGLQMPDALERGAVGVQPGCSFVPVYTEIHRRHLAGDRAGMRSLHTELLPYIAYWMQGVELIIQVEKTILHRRGLVSTDYCRPPGRSLDSGERLVVDEFLERFAEYLA
jgi:dihydrodipicolinate synthase/N-acetylneuraminate lyase